MSNTEPPIEPPEKRIEPTPVLPSSVEAGLVAGLAVAGVFLIRDLVTGAPLATPSALGILLIEGPDPTQPVVSGAAAAAIFHFVHFTLWMLIGAVGIWLVHRVERSPSGWWWPWVGVGVLLLGCVAFDAWAANAGLPRFHLWLGAVIGVAALSLFINWRHPHAMDRVRGIERD